MITIFFYGLFMDRNLLIEKGLHPEVIGPAMLPGYRIHIADRATLLPSAADKAYGILMELPEEEVHILYSGQSVREYLPEQVRVSLLEGNLEIEASCYNLPLLTGLKGTNPAYAKKLSQLVESLGFDEEYVEEIAAFG